MIIKAKRLYTSNKLYNHYLTMIKWTSEERKTILQFYKKPSKKKIDSYYQHIEEAKQDLEPMYKYLDAWVIGGNSDKYTMVIEFKTIDNYYIYLIITKVNEYFILTNNRL